MHLLLYRTHTHLLQTQLNNTLIEWIQRFYLLCLENDEENKILLQV